MIRFALLATVLLLPQPDGWQRETLGTVPKGFRFGRNIAVRPDGMQVAWSITNGKEAWTMLNDRRGSRGRAVDEAYWSKDGRTPVWLYWVGDRNKLRVGDKVLDPRSGPIAYHALSDDARHHVIARRNGSTTTIIRDGTEVAVHKGLVEEGIQVSPDGLHFSYVLQDENYEEWLCVDAKKIEKATSLIFPRPRYTPNGLLVYGANGELVIGNRRWSVDGMPDLVAAEVSVRVTPDGTGFVLAGEVEETEDGNRVVVRNGKRIFQGRAVGSLLMSRDGSVVAFSGKEDEKWEVDVNGRRSEEYDQVGSLQFAPDGRTVVYRARKGTEYYLGVGSRVLGPIPMLLPDPAVGPGGKRFAYRVRRGGETIILDQDGTELGRHQHVRLLTIGPKGDRLVYVAGRGRKEHLIVDGTERRGYERIVNLELQLDGEGVAAVVRDGLQVRVVVGGRASSACEKILAGPKFSRDGRTVWFVGVDGGRIFRESLKLD